MRRAKALRVNTLFAPSLPAGRGSGGGVSRVRGWGACVTFSTLTAGLAFAIFSRRSGSSVAQKEPAPRMTVNAAGMTSAHSLAPSPRGRSEPCPHAGGWDFLFYPLPACGEGVRGWGPVAARKARTSLDFRVHPPAYCDELALALRDSRVIGSRSFAPSLLARGWGPEGSATTGSESSAHALLPPPCLRGGGGGGVPRAGHDRIGRCGWHTT